MVSLPSMSGLRPLTIASDKASANFWSKASSFGMLGSAEVATWMDKMVCGADSCAEVGASVSCRCHLRVLLKREEWVLVLNSSRWADAYSVRSNRERAVWYLVESSRRSGEPSRSDLESSLGSGEMGSSAMLHVGGLLWIAVLGALELPACMER